MDLETSELKALVDKFYPFFVEIRKRFFFVLIVFAVSTSIGFFFYESIIKILIDILGVKGVNIVFTSPFQFINLAINCGVATGLLFSLPLLVRQVLSFLQPALKRNEFRTLIRLLPFSFIFFVSGFIVGIMIMKWQIEIFLNRASSIGIGNILDISKLLNTVLLTGIFTGISFQFPIILILLLRLGIIKPHQLARRRGLIYLGAFIFAILLPVDSILADILIAIPLVAMFEVTLIVNRLSNYKKSF